MIRYFMLALLLACGPCFAQTDGYVYGKVTDQTNTEIPFVGILVLSNGSTPVTQCSSDLSGNFKSGPIPPGTYSLKLFAIGYASQIINNVHITAGKGTLLNVKLEEAAVKLCEVEVVTRGARGRIDACYASISVCRTNLSGSSSSRKGRLRRKGSRSKNQSESVANGESYNQSGRKGVDPKLKVHSTLYDRIFGGNSVEFNREQYSKIEENNFKEVKYDPLSTISIDVDRAAYSNMRRFITKGSLPPADAVRVEEMINYFPYEYAQPAGNVPVAIQTEFTQCPWNKKHQLVHVGIQGKTVKPDHVPVNNLVFLIDVSGSMNEEDKLPLVKSGLRLLVDQLKAEDKVSLVVYAGQAGQVLAPTSGNEKEKILGAINRLEAGGSTAGAQGIELAYQLAKENFLKEGNNRVILATDGDFNVGISSDAELERMIEKKREDGIYLTVLGFGTGNYQDAKMEQLADKGNGNYAYIDNIMEAKKVLVNEMNGTLLSIANDVKIQIEFNPVKVKAYRLMGYENRLLNKEDFNDDKKDAGEMGSGHSVTAIYEIIPEGSEEVFASVDELKYQKVSRKFLASDEIATVKCRYKLPGEKQSKLITEIIGNSKNDFESTSENCRFACAVAEFGMLLRDSEHKGNCDFKTVLATARQSKGKDAEGYRAEFIRLVEMAELMKK